MKESSKYLAFFRRNLIFLIIPTLLLGLLGYVFVSKKPTTYTLSELLKMEYSDNNVNERISLTDQAVTELRSASVDKSLGVGESVSIFKPGPLSIQINISSSDRSKLSSAPDQLTRYATSNFKLSQIGDRVESQTRQNPLIGLIAGLGVGFVCGLLITLIREYLRSY